MKNEKVAPGPWVARNIWVIDLVRALASIIIGTGILSAERPGLRLLLFIGLGVYLLIDGLTDITASWLLRRRGAPEQTYFFAGIISALAGIGVIVLQGAMAVVVAVWLALRLIVHGGRSVWRAGSLLWRPERENLGNGERFGWLVGVGQIVAGILILVFSPLLLQIVFLYFGVYFVVDGIISLNTAAMKRGLAQAYDYMPTTPMAPENAPVPIEVAGRPEALRVVAFVRRSGANGLGHAGWAFEWPTGWFNAGAVENPLAAAFAAPDKMGFWTMHTLDPVGAMMAQSLPYDEYKVLFVDKPNPRAAWKSVVWLSRQPYSLRRRNCADCAYDVLRSYGLTRINDTSQKTFPNEWYDALPARSYRISQHPTIPVRPERMARLERLGVRQIPLTIPERIQAKAPMWREGGGHAWSELQSRVELINQQALIVLRLLVRRMRHAFGSDPEAAESLDTRRRIPQAP